MKRTERTTLNHLRKNVTDDTLYVEIPTAWSHEAKQAIHELLTISKRMYAIRVCAYSSNRAENCILYYHTYSPKLEQENADIDYVVGTVPVSDYTWNGYHRDAC